MSDKELYTSYSFSELSIFPLNLMLFSAGKFFFGVCSSQVKRVESRNYPQSSMSSAGLGNLEYQYISKNSLKFGTDLIISKDDSEYYRVGVGYIEDMILASQRDVIPFPALIQPWTMHRGMWAVMLRNQRIYILLDFKRFIGYLSENRTAICGKHSPNSPLNDSSLHQCNNISAISNEILLYSLFNGELTIVKSELNEGSLKEKFRCNSI